MVQSLILMMIPMNLNVMHAERTMISPCSLIGQFAATAYNQVKLWSIALITSKA